MWLFLHLVVPSAAAGHLLSVPGGALVTRVSVSMIPPGFW